MVVVVVAGGTGALGRSIVEAIVSCGKHNLIILSCTADLNKEKELGVSIVKTDYQDVALLAQILENNIVHTVVSTLAMMPNSGGPLEQNLIRAADISKTTKRIVSSEYGFPQYEEDGDVFPSILMKQKSLRELEASKDLEWTCFYAGFFMDYFGLPKLPSRLTPFVVLLDILESTAAIPGDGDRIVTFTHTSDVGKFVAASLDLEKWDHDSFIIGTKFEVAYDDLEKLKRGMVTELPSQRSLYSFIPKEYVQAICSRFGIWVNRGEMDFNEDTSLNKRLPDLKTLKFKELLEKAWEKRGVA